MKHIFILNPTAGAGDAKKLKSKIQEYCDKNEINYELIETKYCGHASKIANQFGINHDVIIYSVGGDGTAYEILNGVNDKVPVAIIPAGTGNDFYRMISNDNSNVLKCITDCINGVNVTVDYGVANQRRFLNSTTVGLDARINNLACDVLKKPFIPKQFIYGMAASIGVLNPKPFSMTLNIDGRIVKQKALLVGVMNGKYYGKGIAPIADVSIQDGMFNVIVIDNIPLLKLFALLPKYFKGETQGLKEVHFYSGSKITIETDIEVDAQSDGENFKTKFLTFDIMKNALNLRVPYVSKLSK